MLTSPEVGAAPPGVQLATRTTGRMTVICVRNAHALAGQTVSVQARAPQAHRFITLGQMAVNSDGSAAMRAKVALGSTVRVVSGTRVISRITVRPMSGVRTLSNLPERPVSETTAGVC